MSAKQLANIIKSDPNYIAGTPVQLQACNAGLVPPGGRISPAKALADELGVGVWGANNFVWPHGLGTIVAPTNSGASWQNYTHADGLTGPNLNAGGRYIFFTPKAVL